MSVILQTYMVIWGF